jgi:magnesium transporter
MPSDRMPSAAPLGCAVRCVSFDFEHKRELEVELAAVPVALEEGQFVWIDVARGDQATLHTFLLSLGLISRETIEDMLSPEPVTQLARFEDYVTFALTSCTLSGSSGAAFEVARTDCALGASFLLTMHHGPAPFIERMRKQYHQEFARFARTPSFLVYQLWDQLVESYVDVQRTLEARVAELHTALAQPSDEDVFERVGKLGIDLLSFRRVVVPARGVVRDLSTRRSLFLSELTQSNLGNLGHVLDHVLQELVIDREILSESLALHESVVSHRTNEVMKKLTIVSVVFLPLTFLCGVYGMNFEHLPELQWRYGYALFWLAVVAVVLGIAWGTRRARLW